MAEFDFIDTQGTRGSGGLFGAGTTGNSGGKTSTENTGDLPTWNAFTTDLDPDKEVNPSARDIALRSTGEIDEQYGGIGDNYSFSKSNSSSAQSVTDPKLLKLREERDVALKNLSEAQVKYNKIVNGEHNEALVALKELCDTKQAAYVEAVQGSNNAIIMMLKNRILENENDITSTEEFIKDYTVDIEKTNTDLAVNKNQLNDKDKKIITFKNKISSLNGKLGSAVDEKDKQYIQTQISALQSQLGQEEAQKSTLETIKTSLESKKTELENEKKKAEDKLKALENEKIELDKRVKASFDLAVKQALQEYNMARTAYKDLVAKVEAEKTEALNGLAAAREEITKIEEKISIREAEVIQEKIQEEAKKKADAEAVRASAQSAIGGGNSFGINNDAADKTKVEDLQRNVSKAKEDLIAKETELSNIYEGKSEEINRLKIQKNNNFNLFIEIISNAGETKLAGELKALKQNVDKFENVYMAKSKAVSEYESKLGIATSSSNQLTQKITSLQEAQSTLKGTDKSQLDAERLNLLMTTLNDLNSELINLTNEKQKTETIINDAKTLQKLKEERDKAKADYENANNSLTAKMKQAIESHPNIVGLSKSFEKYDKSNTDYNNTVNSKVTSLNSDITVLRSKVNELSQTLGAAEGKVIKNKYRFIGGSGGAIVDLAKSFIGKNEYDGSADIFWKEQGVNWSSSKMPWCAAFVSYVLKNSGVDFGRAYTFSVSGLRQWGESNNKFISGSCANSSNVKPGDVVIWKGGYFSSHTGIVTAVYDDGTYDTIEGNSSNKVAERKGNGTTGKYKMSKTTGFVSV